MDRFDTAYPPAGARRFPKFGNYDSERRKAAARENNGKLHEKTDFRKEPGPQPSPESPADNPSVPSVLEKNLKLVMSVGCPSRPKANPYTLLSLSMR